MRRNHSRRDLLAVSSMAMATGLMVGVSAAQAQVALPEGSYQANGSFAGGGGAITTGTGTTDISVSTPTAVINWSPFDASGNGVINFQPAGTTATFHNSGFGGDNFAVLNRVLPSDASRPIQFNGTTISQIQGDVSTGPGGTVFFYSPGGILVSPTAVFDVGNLVLTTSDLAYDASGNSFGSGDEYKFLPANAGTSVEIAALARITAGGASNAYVALIAPKVVQSGTLNVDGSVALVAADAATIRFSPDGLFSISVDRISPAVAGDPDTPGGTSASGTVLTSNGSITGPAGTAGTFNHRIYMVAVPKNDAITMAISSGSTLGFDIAGAADVDGNAIVLSSGYDIVAGAVANTRSAGGGTGQADIAIGAGTFTSALSAKATGLAALTVSAGQTADFASDLTMAGVSNLDLVDTSAAHIQISGVGGRVHVGGNLDLLALDAGVVTGSGVSDSTFAALDVNRGTLSVDGDLTIDAGRLGAVEGQSVTGGTAALKVLNSGLVTVGGDLSLLADGEGGIAATQDIAQSGDGTGGTAKLEFGTGSTITVGGSLFGNARGLGGSVRTFGYGGGSGSGGEVLIAGTSGGGTLDITGNVSLEADGLGATGSFCFSCGFDGGHGQGGSVRVEFHGASAFTTTVDGNFDASVSGEGGDADFEAPGQANGGSIALLADGAKHTFTVGGYGYLDSTAIGGRGNDRNGGSAGAGSGRITVQNGASFGFGGALTIDAHAEGGGYIGFGNGGNASGGLITIETDATGGAITSGNLLLDASAIAGRDLDSSAGSGGLASGGIILAESRGGTMSFGSIALDASADAGDGIEFGGNATGGDARIYTRGGAIHATGNGGIDVSALGGSSGGFGGNATGGIAYVSVRDAPVDVSGNFVIDASATGGNAAGNGQSAGSATGGTVQIEADRGGGISFGGTLTGDARGTGGTGQQSAFGGSGQGGRFTIATYNSAIGPSPIKFGAATINNSGIGGNGGDTGFSGAPAGAGGNGTGGYLIVSSLGNGTINGAAMSATSSGTGGQGGAGGLDDGDSGLRGGDGGTGTAGHVLISAANGVSGFGKMSFTSLAATATGRGGRGGAGGDASTPGGTSGNGLGGEVSIGFLDVTGTTTLVAQGRGANGRGCDCTTDGGAGIGGTITVGSELFGSGSQLRLMGNTSIDASGVGGNSVSTNGANGTGGTVNILAAGGLLLQTSNISVSSVGFGGNAAGAFSGGVGTGGTVLIDATLGGSVAVNGDVSLGANGVGGTNTSSGGVGGNGVGGSVGVGITGGSFGGFSGGAITISKTATLVVNGQGGAGDSVSSAGRGGGGTGGSASLYAGNTAQGGAGGSLTILGDAVLQAAGLGAAGYNGGLGFGGQANVEAHDGSVSGNAISIAAIGQGGNAARGGEGGFGLGGSARIQARSDVDGASSITFTGLTQLGVDGRGGSVGPTLGVNDIAGTGGNGSGGIAEILGSAGNGSIALADVLVNAHGVGGNGAAGAASTVSPGGNGGNGGIGRGGAIVIGMESGIDTADLVSGSATFGNVIAVADGVGGMGGNGGIGALANGNGGNGGAAFGGGVVLQSIGAATTFNGDGQFTANGTGGNGGTGATAGVGGNASVGDAGSAEDVRGAGLIVSSRAGQPEQRGVLTAQALSFEAKATGGAGSATGSATDLGAPLLFLLTRGDVDASALSFVGTGVAGVNAPRSAITLTDGTAQITQDFGFDTQSDLSVSLQGADLFAENVTMSAGNFIAGGATEALPGTIHGASFIQLSSGGDLFAFASLDAGIDLTLNSGRAIRFDDVAVGGSLFANAATSILLGNVTAGDVFLSAGTDLDVGTVSSSGSIGESAGQNLQTGAVTAGQGVFLSGRNAVTIDGAVIAGDSISIESLGDVQGDLLSAGLVNVSGSPDAQYSIAVGASGDIAFGNVQAAHDISLLGASGVSVDVISGRDLVVLSGTDQTFNGIAGTGRVLLSGIDGYYFDGPPRPITDFSSLFASTPLATAGDIRIFGTVGAGSFRALTAEVFTSGPIDSIGSVDIDAGDGAGISRIDAGDSIRVNSGAEISLGSASAQDLLSLTAAGDIFGANMLGVNGVAIKGNDVTVGPITSLAGDVNITATGSLSLELLGGRTTGLPGILAGNEIIVDALGDVTVGNVTSTGSYITITAAGTVEGADFLAQTGIDIGAGDGLSIGLVNSASGPIVLASTGDLDTLAITASSGPVRLAAGGNSVTEHVFGADGVLIDASGNIFGGTVAADRNDVQLFALGSIAVSDITASGGGITLRSGGTFESGQIAADRSISLISASDATILGDIGTQHGNVDFTVGGALVGGAIDAQAGDVRVSATNNATLLDILAENAILVSGDEVKLGALTGSTVTVNAGSGLTAGVVTAQGGDASLTAQFAALTGNVTASGAVTLDAGRELVAGAVLAGGAIKAKSGRNLTLAGVRSTGGDVTLDAGNNLLSGAISTPAGSVSLIALTGLTTGEVSAFGTVLADATVVQMGNIVAGGLVGLRGLGSATIGNIDAGGAVNAISGTLIVSDVTSQAGITLTSDVGSVLAGAIDARGGDVRLAAAQSLTTGDVASSGNIVGTGFGISVGDLTAGGPISFNAEDTLTTGNVVAQHNVFLNAVLDLTAGTVTGARDITLSSGAGNIVTDAIDAQGGALALSTTGNITTAGLKALNDIIVGGAIIRTADVLGSGDVNISAADALQSSTVNAAGNAVLSAGSDLAVTSVTGLADVSLTSTGGGITAGAVTAVGNMVQLSAAGGITTGNITSGNTILASGAGISTGAIKTFGGPATFTSTGPLTTGDIDVSGSFTGSGFTIALGDVHAAGSLTLTATDTLSLGAALVRDDVGLLAGGDIATGDLDAGGRLSLTSTSGKIQAAGLLADGDANITAAGAFSANGLTAAAVTVSADSIDLGHVLASNLSLTAIHALKAASVHSNGDLTLVAGNDLTTDFVVGNGAFTITSTGGSVTTGDLDAKGAIAVNAATSLAVASATTTLGDVSLGAGDNLNIAGHVNADAGAVRLSAGGTMASANINAAGAVSANAQTLTVGDVAGGGDVSLVASSDVTAGAVTTTGGGISVASGGLLTLASASATGGSLNVTPAQAMQTGDLSASDDVVLNGETSIVAGRVTAGGSIIGTAGSSASYASASSGSGPIELAANGGSLSIASSVFGGTDVALVASQNINAGIVTGRDIALLAGGDVVVQSGAFSGSLNPATGAFVPANGRILIADASMADLGGEFGAFDYNAVFASAPVRTEGQVLLGGASGGRFVSASSGSMRSGRITASQSILVDTGGLATVAAQWAAPTITIRSRDIAILQAQSSPTNPSQVLSGLNAGANGSITLVSLDPQFAQIGDGLNDEVYTLDNTEWSRINSGSLTLLAPNFVIGKLDVTGPDAGSTIDDPNGVVRFVAGSSITGQPTGSIRIVGDLKTTGFRPTNALEFATGLFELQSDTGSLSMNGTGSDLSGTLRISADHIHVASGSVLDKLRDNPFYVGMLDDIDGAASSPRPDGVIRAGAFDFFVGQTLLIQNTGTTLDPAGFVTNLAASDITATGQDKITVIVNGKFVTDTGLVGGTKAFDLFKDGDISLDQVAPESRLNHCLLNQATCGETPDGDPGLAGQIEVLLGPGLGDTPDFAPDPDDPDDGADSQPPQPAGPDLGSPISPPPPLIDTRPLNPPPLIDEPVAGSGNPALMGSAVNENTAQGGPN